ncbi:MAG TPA: prolyl oligopeptidase family serine peptidase, partial [Flavobacterium sp.]|nr:prolyl oligopeptidase family serine peptidase [Flavobacterium sp.]
LYIRDSQPTRKGVQIGIHAWTRSNAVFEYDPNTKTLVDTKISGPTPVDMSGIEIKNVKVKSHDGVMLPLVILHKKSLQLDGTSALLMRGYGAYGINGTSPFFDSKDLPWLERGGIVAFAGVRGGGEYGEEWHLAGFQRTKPNTWKDFIACAEYLIEQKYTAPNHLGIHGGSAGGILISNAIAERPDLFSAAIINAGINNTLRYEAPENGMLNADELGSLATEAGFKARYAMDGYQKIRNGVTYPAVLLTHGVNDARVAPWMSSKMAARLQASTSSNKPVLLRMDFDNGQGPGSPRTLQNEELADTFAFLAEQLGMK